MPPSKPPAPFPERPTGRQRRERREMQRREKMMAKSARNPGLRERIIGCGFSLFIVGGIVFVIALVGGLIYTHFFDR